VCWNCAARQEDEYAVEINWFGDMLKWFGPLKRDDSILSTIRAMLRYPYLAAPPSIYFHDSCNNIYLFIY
jgi:hypothetical protein